MRDEAERYGLRLDARGLVLAEVNEQAGGREALRGYLEGVASERGPKIVAPELACLDLVTCHGFQVARVPESPKRLL